MTTPGKISITVNDQRTEIEENSTVADLIERQGLSKRALAVEVNLVLVPHATQSQTVLRSSDQVEIVTLSGGG